MPMIKGFQPDVSAYQHRFCRFQAQAFVFSAVGGRCVTSPQHQ
jgi:hypothetical protein